MRFCYTVCLDDIESKNNYHLHRHNLAYYGWKISVLRIPKSLNQTRIIWRKGVGKVYYVHESEKQVLALKIFLPTNIVRCLYR